MQVGDLVLAQNPDANSDNVLLLDLHLYAHSKTKAKLF